MATEFNGIVYFPTKAAFFEGAVSESLEAKYGIKGPYLVIKILCKIYKEGYYIQWDEEQCEIFAYKLGRE
ncbi:Lin1244/Lin1753 domain-containing protein, partial [Bacteroides sp. 41_26]